MPIEVKIVEDLRTSVIEDLDQADEYARAAFTSLSNIYWKANTSNSHSISKQFGEYRNDLNHILKSIYDLKAKLKA